MFKLLAAIVGVWCGYPIYRHFGLIREGAERSLVYAVGGSIPKDNL